MEIGTDTPARIAADILMAALESKAFTTRGEPKECSLMSTPTSRDSCASASADHVT